MNEKDLVTREVTDRAKAVAQKVQDQITNLAAAILNR
jgi:hypothetical protein